MCKLVYFLFVIICYVCCCNGSETGKNITGEKDLLAESSKNCENTVTLPVYAIYIFGFVLVLLIVLVIFLIFVLMRPKFFEICKKNRNDSENTGIQCNTNSRQEVHQKSLKRLNLNRSHSFEFKNKSSQYQVLKENESTNNNTLKSTNDEFGTLRTPTRTEPSGNISPRIIKGLTKDMPIILPEQMSQICKEVLTRTNKNENTTGSLRDIDNLAKETILTEENEKKYASSPVLDVYDVSDENDKTSDEKKSNKEDFDNQTQIHSNDMCDMPKDLEKSKRKDFGNQTQTHADDMYDMPKQLINSNKEDFDDKKQIPSDNIYDMPKELLDNAQLNYVKPHFPQKTQYGVSQELKESSQRPDYASLHATSSVKESSIDKIDSTAELNAYDFPKSTQMETKMYINANCVT